MITLYMVFKVDSSYTNVLTITDNKKDCDKYISRLLLIDNGEHFFSWCNLRNLEHNEESWMKYLRTVGVDCSNYKIRKMKYKTKDIATLLRLYNKCIPLGCDYDTDEEIENFLSSLTPEKKAEFDDYIKSQEQGK